MSLPAQLARWIAAGWEELLPAWLRALLLPRRRPLLLILDESGAQILSARSGRPLPPPKPGRTSKDSGRFRGRPVILVLPEAQIARAELTLPLTAEPDLPRILALDLDRLLPFAPGQAVWGFRILELRRGGGGGLTVRVAAIARARASALDALLAGAGIRGAGLAGSEDRALLLRPPRPWPLALLAWLNLGLLALALALPLAASLQEIRDLEAEAEALAASRAALSRAAEPALARRQQILALAGGGAKLREILADPLHPLILLPNLAKALPDPVHLTALEVSATGLRLEGFAPDLGSVLDPLGRVPGLPPLTVSEPRPPGEDGLLPFVLEGRRGLETSDQEDP